jgi:hypothetical protein
VSRILHQSLQPLQAGWGSWLTSHKNQQHGRLNKNNHGSTTHSRYSGTTRAKVTTPSSPCVIPLKVRVQKRDNATSVMVRTNSKVFAKVSLDKYLTILSKGFYRGVALLKLWEENPKKNLSKSVNQSQGALTPNKLIGLTSPPPLSYPNNPTSLMQEPALDAHLWNNLLYHTNWALELMKVQTYRRSGTPQQWLDLFTQRTP